MAHLTSTSSLKLPGKPPADAYSSQLLNEIMPMIYKRFTEKSAEEWRQIYKALQLMEFLVKNGSERVIDDARSHLSLLKMLRQFHYIDQNGKDQGINVRNRSKELTDLLSDVDRIRSERKKARATRNKYRGVEGGAGLGSGMSSSSRYGGFGSEDGGGYGGHTRDVYGDGGGFGGESQMEYDAGDDRSQSRGRERFEEYDEFDDGGAQAPPGRRKAGVTRSTRNTPKKAEPPKPKAPEVDLFEFGDDPPAAPVASASNGKAPAALPADDDDFDDFQAAPTPTLQSPPIAQPSIPKPNYSSIAMPASTSTTTSQTQYAQPTPQSGAQKADFSNLFSTMSPPPSSTSTPSQMSGFASPPMQAQQPKPSGYQPSGPNYYTSVQAGQATSQVGTPSGGIKSPPLGSQPAKKAGGADPFGSLLAGSGIKKSTTPSNKGMTIADMAKQKSSAGIWGAASTPSPAPMQAQNGSKPTTGSSGMDDLLG